jgi:hypothetical protein
MLSFEKPTHKVDRVLGFFSSSVGDPDPERIRILMFLDLPDPDLLVRCRVRIPGSGSGSFPFLIKVLSGLKMLAK